MAETSNLNRFRLKSKRFALAYFCFLITALFSNAFPQSSTRGTISNVQTNEEIVDKHKVMLIPFEPKMFMCEIGKNIAKETNMSFDQIRNTFQKGVDFSLLMDVRHTFSTISLLADSSNTNKDLDYIFESISYSYDKVQEEILEDKKIDSKKKTEKDSKKPGIQNGEIAVEINKDKRFMNTKITNKELLNYLSKKYETDLFLFVNQLDIRNVASEKFDINSNGLEREITLHYTLLDNTNKQLDAGISTSRFSSQLNDPKKIIDRSISIATKTIASKLTNTMIPPKPDEKKKLIDKISISEKVK